jgi:hypothetical protein
MVSTTVYLDEQTLAALKGMSKGLAKPQAQLIRGALRAFTRTGNRPLLSAGMGMFEVARAGYPRVTMAMIRAVHCKGRYTSSSRLLTRAVHCKGRRSSFVLCSVRDGMISNVNRKEAAKEFKARKVPKGIFAIRCRTTEAVWVDSSPNLDAARNGAWFQLRSGLHRDKRLQEEWNTRGEEAFEFEVLETLHQDVSAVNLLDILRDKKQKWVRKPAGGRCRAGCARKEGRCPGSKELA